MIGLDTNVFIYHLASHDKYGELATRLMKEIQAGLFDAVASMIVFGEVMTYPAKIKDEKLFIHYREILLNYPNLKFIPADSGVCEEAAGLRGHYPNLKMLDALILATAVHQKAQVLVTEDKQLHALKLSFPILSLENFFKKFV